MPQVIIFHSFETISESIYWWCVSVFVCALNKQNKLLATVDHLFPVYKFIESQGQTKWYYYMYKIQSPMISGPE